MLIAQLTAELDALNVAVDAAVKARTAWLDAHMADAALHPIGTEVFTEDGKPLGVIQAYYRYHAGDMRFDDALEIHYRFTNGDNTSRQMLRPSSCYDAEQLAKRCRARADMYAAQAARRA